MHHLVVPSLFSNILRITCAVCLCSLTATRSHAVELTLFATDVTMPAGRTFQLPLTASDSMAAPLTFSIVSISSSNVTGTIAPASNRSLLLNVGGVNALSNDFTGDLVLQLYEDLVPLTTARIITLATNGFYDGLKFHRVIQDFMCQGGDPLGNGTGGTGTKFDDEFEASLTFNGFGQLAMANSGDDSNDSQFFITDADLSIADAGKPSPHWLNFQHTIFGQLTRGFDVLTKILETPVGANDAPITPVLIHSASLIADRQDAVVRLTAAAGITEEVDVVITAANAGGESATQTVHVTVAANTVNAAAFLGPVPADLVTTQGIAASFPLVATDIDGDQMTFSLLDALTGTAPSQLSNAFIDQTTGRLMLVPNLTFTGVVELILRVKDGTHPYDTQHFTLTVLAPAQADLAVSKTGSPDPVQAGSNLTYTITITNLGPDTATAVTATDTLPANVAFVSATDGCITNGLTVTCALGDLASGATSTITIIVTPNSPGTITNSIAVSAHEDDPAAGNNTAQAITVVNPNQPPASSLTGLFSSVKEKCKTKHEVTTCSLSVALSVQNSLPADLPPTRIEFWLSADGNFDAGDDHKIGEGITKAIKAGKAGKLKLKAPLEMSAAGSFLLAVDDTDAVVASYQIPAQ